MMPSFVTTAGLAVMTVPAPRCLCPLAIGFFSSAFESLLLLLLFAVDDGFLEDEEEDGLSLPMVFGCTVGLDVYVMMLVYVMMV